MAGLSVPEGGRRSPLTLNREELSSTYSTFFMESTIMAE